MKIVTFITLLTFMLVGCKNNQAKEQAKATQDSSTIINESRTPLDEACEAAYNKKETLYELIRIPVVKEYIIKEYSSKFYNKLINTVHVTSPIKYTNGVYEVSGISKGDGSAYFTYCPTKNQLNIDLTINGYTIQPDGNMQFNTEGWRFETLQNKNEFGEVLNLFVGAEFVIKNEGDSYSGNKLVVTVYPDAIILWTNDFGGLCEVESIQIKDHDSGKIYNISYDESYHHRPGGLRNDDIGVIMTKSNGANFINIVSGLTNYSILLKSDYNTSVLIQKPQNLANIIDVYERIITETKELSANEDN